MIENKIGSFKLPYKGNLEENDKKLTHHSILYTDNKIYIGTYDENWKRQGFGELLFIDGCKYSGEFKNNMMNGK
jgi:hypothetical protein